MIYWFMLTDVVIKWCVGLCWQLWLWNDLLVYVDRCGYEIMCWFMLTDVVMKWCVGLCWQMWLWNDLLVYVDRCGYEMIYWFMLTDVVMKWCVGLCWHMWLWNDLLVYVDRCGYEMLCWFMLTDVVMKLCVGLCWQMWLWNCVGLCWKMWLWNYVLLFFTQPFVDRCHGCEIVLLKANIYPISSDTHQLHYIPLHHFNFHFDMNGEGFVAVRLTWPAYDDGRKRENSSAWKDRIIVASTCRRSVEFGCYITWLWMANCVSVMTKMLPLYNFTIPYHGRRAWKTSREARATAGLPEAVSDWLNPFSLGTMSASAYFDNLA